MQIHGEKLAFALERLWGWPTKLARIAFPNFGVAHIVRPDRIPPLKKLCIYHSVDPHGQRNWFMVWTGVDVTETKWTFKEWPDAENYGEWALPGSKPDGRPGPAQNAGGGRGFVEYQQLIYDLEGWSISADGIWQRGDGLAIHDRQMDPRPAGTRVPSDEESGTYLEMMAKTRYDASGKMVMPGLDFRAGPHCGIEE